MRNIQQEIVISSILIILLLLFLNPSGFWMPSGLLMIMILGLIIVFVIFTSFIWKENAKDERELAHNMLAGKLGFIVGASILLIGIIIQSLKHSLDYWLVITLAAMVLAKIIGLIYSRLKN